MKIYIFLEYKNVIWGSPLKQHIFNFKEITETRVGNSIGSKLKGFSKLPISIVSMNPFKCK